MRFKFNLLYLADYKYLMTKRADFGSILIQWAMGSRIRGHRFNAEEEGTLVSGETVPFSVSVYLDLDLDADIRERVFFLFAS